LRQAFSARGYRGRVNSRLVSLVAVLAVVAGMASGCAPEAAPEPTPSFASEKEAFAAAEATYRAYVDALNQVDLSDPETFEDVYAWTTGDANAGARKSFSQMHADGWTVGGRSTFDNFAGLNLDESAAQKSVTAEVCLDVTDVTVVDSSGASVVPAERRDRQAALLTFALADSPTGLLIESSTATDGSTCG
jgi:hypothetical protein